MNPRNSLKRRERERVLLGDAERVVDDGVLQLSLLVAETDYWE